MNDALHASAWGEATMPNAISGPPDPHLTTADLARRWRVAPASLRNDRVAGKGCPFLKIGRSVRYRLADVAEFEAAHLAASTAAGVGR